ncbi:DUF2285 domain-containing protein [Rhizorhabdus histidinilytica]|uniref:DUF2285 domain-containing protein n=1 Tax=Rhizorhabdus histidinilytica TaxID=439228 RepID=UPI0032204497
MSALTQSVLWSPVVVPSVLTLAPAPEHLSHGATPPLRPLDAGRDSPEGKYALYDGDSSLQVLMMPGSDPTKPAVAIIPLDGDMLGRIETLTRLWRSLRGQKPPPDTRMTQQQRRRLRRMIQAADGRMNGASYREIAMAIYGEPRISAESWKTSPLRASIIGLVKGGLDAINGGYLNMLRHRRRN